MKESTILCLNMTNKKPRPRDPREYYPWLNMFSSPQLYLGYQGQCVVHSIKSLWTCHCYKTHTQAHIQARGHLIYYLSFAV